MDLTPATDLLTDHLGCQSCWVNRINLDSLDMGESRFCVLGQLFSTFPNGVNQLSLTDEEACGLGFDLGFDLQENALRTTDFTPLTETWIAHLTTLKEQTQHA